MTWSSPQRPINEMARLGGDHVGRLRMRAACLLIFLLAILVVPSAGMAHAEFRGSDPPANALLDAAPEQVVIEFSEPVSPMVVQIVPSGGPKANIEARSRDSRLIVPLPKDLGHGTHLLSWRIISIDGHPVGGTLVFSVGSTSAVDEPIMSGTGTAWLAAATRFALTLALVVGVGGTVFIVVVANTLKPANLTRRSAAAGCVAVFPLAALAVGTQGLDMMGLPAGALLSAVAWKAGIASTLAVTAAVAALSAAVAFVTLRLGDPDRRLPYAVAGWGLAALSFALSGHAAVADPKWIAMPAVALHGFALIFWMGCLLPLLILLFNEEKPTPVISRFSALAMPLVAMLVATGAVLTLLQSGNARALLTSSYGGILLAKLAAVGGLLLLALRNKLKLTPRLNAGHGMARRQMAGMIRLEIVLGLIAIALASSFQLTPPPRSIAAPSTMQVVELPGHEVHGSIEFKPGRIGSNSATLRLANPHGAGLEPLEVKLKLSLPSRQIEPMVISAKPGPDGAWMAHPVILPVPGDWRVDVDVLITDFRKATLTSILNVPER